MDIILLKDVEKLGSANEIVTVKDGYGRNYLIPYGYALIANKKNRATHEEKLRKEREVEEKQINQYKEYLTKLEGKVLKIGAKAGTSGKIFGSVTNIQIAQALSEQAGVNIERKAITLLEEVKELGTYSAKLSLHKEVEGTVSFEVVAD